MAITIYEKLGMKKLINAADSYTILGGSLIPPEVWKAMEEASQSFVWIEELHNRVGERLAELTRNEAAMVTSGAAAGLSIAVAACITGTERKNTRKFPKLKGLKKEVILLRCQRNGFDMAISQIGARIIEVGDVESTSAWQLQDAINAKTACIVYFTSTYYSRGALSLQEVLDIAKPLGIPVVIDAAAQLPPVDNLWLYTQMGADLVIFSGGKTLRGPQSAGLIVGRKALIEACRMNVGPQISVGRPMKVGKEEMVGLLAAVERYVTLDHGQLKLQYESFVEIIREELSTCGYEVRRVYPGPTGQDYPRAAVKTPLLQSATLKEQLEHSTPSIIVALSADNEEILINPLHLEREDLDLVLQVMRDISTTWEAKQS
ncbi:aminotransferase class V-fold PLP-dependent enzyme [Paenibacillus eucommiae]|uniref:L-seryl-tRNA(Ser) seleniumtransferase n=1 Tax=Paenibacillus eucommiae TaxID=1355755 RepID=A0ABS4J9D1_9BACL|nr:aminotransferase class V-fold PLP-dependent enzyme [Paenibacillus eucommiae]MBP1995866.1 L-seryl-tRNA(Ser) seleniumtransferase [Paenibacillus eucommiae]